MPDKYLREVAAESNHTIDELEETRAKIIDVYQESINEHYKRCKLESGRDYWLTEEFDGVWLAQNVGELCTELSDSGIEYKHARVRAVAIAGLRRFQQGKRTFKVAAAVARSYQDPHFYAIFIPFPEQWQAGRYNAYQELRQYVSRYDMTAAEALDFWTTERINTDAIEWAAYRDVGVEAVRKNVRQAREKLTDDDRGATHERADMRVASVDEINDKSAHDLEDDWLYVPTTEQIEQYDE